jgi:hypothetical protein
MQSGCVELSAWPCSVPWHWRSCNVWHFFCPWWTWYDCVLHIYISLNWSDDACNWIHSAIHVTRSLHNIIGSSSSCMCSLLCKDLSDLEDTGTAQKGADCLRWWNQYWHWRSSWEWNWPGQSADSASGTDI